MGGPTTTEVRRNAVANAVAKAPARHSMGDVLVEQGLRLAFAGGVAACSGGGGVGSAPVDGGTDGPVPVADAPASQEDGPVKERCPRTARTSVRVELLEGSKRSWPIASLGGEVTATGRGFAVDLEEGAGRDDASGYVLTFEQGSTTVKMFLDRPNPLTGSWEDGVEVRYYQDGVETGSNTNSLAAEGFTAHVNETLGDLLEVTARMVKAVQGANQEAPVVRMVNENVALASGATNVRSERANDRQTFDAVESTGKDTLDITEVLTEQAGPVDLGNGRMVDLLSTAEVVQDDCFTMQYRLRLLPSENPTPQEIAAAPVIVVPEGSQVEIPEVEVRLVPNLGVPGEDAARQYTLWDIHTPEVNEVGTLFATWSAGVVPYAEATPNLRTVFTNAGPLTGVFDGVEVVDSGVAAAVRGVYTVRMPNGRELTVRVRF